jgi:hypothetical protein
MSVDLLPTRHFVLTIFLVGGMTSMGWAMHLLTLAQYFMHFAGRSATYVEADGPPSSTGQDSWPMLLGALGLTEPIEPGVAVALALPGVGSTDGVIDYVATNFVGLRTADALIRFHGGAPIGMTVAVSHHAYVEGFDAAGAHNAWESWLQGSFS